MIKMTYAQLSHYQFVQALQKMNQAPLQIKMAYQLKKITDELAKQKKLVSEEFQTLINTYIQKDEAGGIKFDDQGNYACIEGKEEEFKAAHAEFGKKEFSFDREPLDCNQLEVKLTAVELAHLEPLLANVGEIQ